MEHSREVMKEASRSIDGIMSSVTEINNINTQVAKAAEQQSSVTTHVNASVASVLDLVEQNVTGVHQSASTATQLSNLAEEQNEKLSFFK